MTRKQWIKSFFFSKAATFQGTKQQKKHTSVEMWEHRVSIFWVTVAQRQPITAILVYCGRAKSDTVRTKLWITAINVNGQMFHSGYVLRQNINTHNLLEMWKINRFWGALPGLTALCRHCCWPLQRGEMFHTSVNFHLPILTCTFELFFQLLKENPWGIQSFMYF